MRPSDLSITLSLWVLSITVIISDKFYRVLKQQIAPIKSVVYIEMVSFKVLIIIRTRVLCVPSSRQKSVERSRAFFSVNNFIW